MRARTGAATIVVLAALLLVGGLVGAIGQGVARAQATSTGEAPAGPGPATWTVTPFTVDVTTGPEDTVEVTIDADLWVPSTATAADPAPAIVHTHGFGGSKQNAESLANAAYFASHGYVVVTHSTQGFGGSTGCIGLDSTDYDAKNLGALVDVLATMPEVATDAPGDPQVGLLGGSYGGGLQAGAAFLDPRIDAIAIGRSWNALQYSLVPNNWVVDPAAAMLDLQVHEQGVFKQQWTSLFFGSGQSQPAMGNGGCDPVSQQAAYPGSPPCTGFIPDICPIYAALTTTGNSLPGQRELIFRSSAATYLDQIDTPTLVVQGMPDTLFTPTEAAATFVAQRDGGAPAAMIWHAGGHGGYNGAPGEAEAYGGQYDDSAESQDVFSRGYLPRRTLNWFERHVRGRDVDTGPAFTWFRDWVDYDVAATGGTAAPAYGAATDFPDPDVPVVTLHLDPSQGSLATAPGSGSAQIVSPPGGVPAAYTETANFTGDAGEFSGTPPREVEGQHVTFDTEPMTVDTEFVGIPTAALQLSHANPAVDLRFFAKLYEVDADGSATLLRRQVAASRIPTSEADAGAVTVLLPPVANLIEAGNRIRLVVATTDVSYYNERAGDLITISSSADAPSTVALPLRAIGALPDPSPEPTPEPAPEPTPEPLPATGGGAALGAVATLALATAIRRRVSSGG